MIGIPLAKGRVVRFDAEVPKAVHRICPACQTSTEGAEVDAVARVLRCDLCGAATSFELLPPLLFLTGASGTAGASSRMARRARSSPAAVRVL